ncbi:putative component of type VI protein secretion system [Spinactinospora alkalitolerans]|uniref:Putative component of type VI protein secretion system n=1 Tax=Spinactinospora alkalitolerans TaxID=687207 RepID=A0A852U8U3_9ACTN|nr:putative component of type VI protein secretion system [Spinactinospora alkalitolerans]
MRGIVCVAGAVVLSGCAAEPAEPEPSRNRVIDVRLWTADGSVGGPTGARRHPLTARASSGSRSP